MGFFEKLAEVAAKTKERLNEVATQAQDQLAKAATQLQEQLAEAGSQATGTTGSCSSGVHVVLENYAFENKVALMELVARLKGIPLAKAKQLVEQVPAVVAISPSQMQALEVVSQIAALKGAASVHASAKAARQHIDTMRRGTPRSSPHTQAAVATTVAVPSAPNSVGRDGDAQADRSHDDSAGKGGDGIGGVNTLRARFWRTDLSCLLDDSYLSSLCRQHLEGFDASQWKWNAKGAIWSESLASVNAGKVDGHHGWGCWVHGYTYAHPLLSEQEPLCKTQGCHVGERYVSPGGALRQRTSPPPVLWEVVGSDVAILSGDYYTHQETSKVFLRRSVMDLGNLHRRWRGGEYEREDSWFAPVKVTSGHLLAISRKVRFRCEGCDKQWSVGHHVLVPALT